MKKNNLIPTVVVSALLCSSSVALAKVSPEEAAKLGESLTCMGAEAGANKAGTIPAYTGKWLGTPPGVEYTPHVGQHPVDPYAGEKPVLVIDGSNWQQYADNLTAGQKAMFERYPDSFKMPVYPGHRDFRYPDKICEVSKQNAVTAELIDEGFGFTGYKGAIPFPIPNTDSKDVAMQLLANQNFPYRPFSYKTVQDVADVASDGSKAWGRTENGGLNLTSLPEEVGAPMEGVMAYSINSTLLPVREKGSSSVTSEPVNFARGTRLAWNYNPGTRRVRQLPEYGFDTPLAGTSGKVTLDSARLFNGSPERYEWVSLGKKEIYIPANAYKIHDKSVKYDDLLTNGHANPDYMRYELRRVWVLEGRLKDGYRHRYGKRTMYLDEDSWHGVIADFYDTRDTLVQHAFINYYYAFDSKGYEAGTSFYHDLTTGGYVAYNLIQEMEKGPILNNATIYSRDDFTPAALRRKSH